MQKVKSRKSVKNTDYYKGAAMKNWKFIKVENKDTPELREKLRDIDEQIKNWEHAKGIDGVEKANAQKTIDDLKKERSKIQQEITTGNTAHSDKVEVIKRLLSGGWSVEDIYSLLKTEGYEVEKGFIEKLKVGNSEFKDVIWTVEDEDGAGSDFQSESIAYATARKWAREKGEPVNIFKTELDENGRPKGQPKFVKTVNSSIQRQEWSMFKGLSKDAEKEVGNKGQWDSKKMVYAKWDEGKGRPSEEFAKITWLGDGKGGLVNVWKGSQMTSEKFGSNDLEELRRWAEQRIGNGALDYKLVGPKSQPAKYKVGEEVKTNKGKGKILKVQPMMLSPTPTYLIELDNGSKEWRYEEEIGNKKIGNADPDKELKNEYNAEIHRLAKKAEQLRNMGQGRSAMKVEEQIEKLEWELMHLFKAGNKKTGNARTKEQLLADVRELTKYIQEHNGQGCEKEKRLLGEAKEELDKNYGILVNNLCRARNAIKTKNGMGVSDLEAQIRKNKEFIRQQKMRMNGKSKPEQDDIAEGIREAEEEIDRMEMRIAELKETGNKKVGNKKYHVWTDNGSWDMIVDEKELEGLKRTYKNFHYEEVKEG